MKELLSALVKFWIVPPQQWHPWIIHFPIALLVLELGFTVLFWVNRKPQYAAWSKNLLTMTLVTMLLAMLAGVHDSGLDLGSGNHFLLGLQDRLKSAFIFHSSVTVHTWLALVLFSVTAARSIWRKWQAENALKMPQAYAYGVLSFINLWLLLAAGHAGSVANHR
ncbi:MAG: hypothetical protein HYR55_14995 [Acidobacteria bacterium]|nr:hypothetical protein [Acidobacteriota bacterium]MBI3657045.1 hypothetical protein [Acidobacteriota bacterium]